MADVIRAADTRDTSRRTERLLAAIHLGRAVRVDMAASDVHWLLERITALEDELAEAHAELAWHRGEHEA